MLSADFPTLSAPSSPSCVVDVISPTTYCGPAPPRPKAPLSGELSPKVTERLSQIWYDLSVSAFRRATSPERGGFSLRRGSPLRPCGPAPLDKGSPWGISAHEKRAGLSACSFGLLSSDRALNLVGTQASCTDIHMARSTVNDCLDTFDVGLPCTVSTSVRVGDLDTECHALAADIAFCHQLHLLAAWKSV